MLAPWGTCRGHRLLSSDIRLLLLCYKLQRWPAQPASTRLADPLKPHVHAGRIWEKPQAILLGGRENRWVKHVVTPPSCPLSGTPMFVRVIFFTLCLCFSLQSRWVIECFQKEKSISGISGIMLPMSVRGLVNTNWLKQSVTQVLSWNLMWR